MFTAPLRNLPRRPGIREVVESHAIAPVVELDRKPQVRSLRASKLETQLGIEPLGEPIRDADEPERLGLDPHHGGNQLNAAESRDRGDGGGLHRAAARQPQDLDGSAAVKLRQRAQRGQVDAEEHGGVVGMSGSGLTSVPHRACPPHLGENGRQRGNYGVTESFLQPVEPHVLHAQLIEPDAQDVVVADLKAYPGPIHQT